MLRNEPSAVEGTIHIAAPADMSVQYLAGWLGEYALTHQRLAITLHVGDRLHELPREAVDIAIRYGDLDDSSLISRLLLRTERVLVVSPEYLAKSARLASPDDLEHHRCLAWMMRGQPRIQWTFYSAEGVAHAIAIKPFLCGDGPTVREWALLGHGVAYKALTDVLPDLRAGRLVRVLPDCGGERVPIHAVLPSGSYMPTRVRAVLNYLCMQFASVDQERTDTLNEKRENS